MNAWKSRNVLKAIFFLVVTSASSLVGATDKPGHEPTRQSIRAAADGTIVFRTEEGKESHFRPRFLLLHSTIDPKLAARPGELGKMNYNVASWIASRGSAGGGLRNEDTSVTAGDGHDERILKGDTRQRTADYLSSSASVEMIATHATIEGEVVEWHFEPNKFGNLSAKVQLSDKPWPTLVTHFTASETGFYSLGYAGAPESSTTRVEEIWQPLVWHGRRFPDQSYLTLAYRCTVPATMVTENGVTTSVVVDPQMLPFQPLPLETNSRFGVAVRNENGQMQSLAFAPVLGGAGSQMQPGETEASRFRLMAEPGRTSEAYERIARDLYGFEDYRTNAVGSLNEALENMIAYGLGPYSQFNEELRGCSYSTDVPGAIKNVSSLHPLSAALVTDDPEIYERRARPIIEYMLSREKFLFAVSPKVKIQNPSWRLKGPCAPTSELATLFEMTGGSNPYLLDLARETLDKTRTLNLDTPSPPRRWDKVFAVAKATKDDALLSEAMQRADEYLEREILTSPDDFRKQGASFWDELVPLFPELFMLYESTGKERYLDAAHDAARAYARFVWLCPEIPDEQVLVNPGGKAPHYWYLRNKGHRQMAAPEANVDAWRLSEIGLVPEGPPTSTGHRGVFLATHAPWMLRIGALANDRFLHDIARSAVIGRYRNFPGYHMNTARTTVYEAADYPLRDHKELSYNSFHYNHIWPHAALLVDYLVSDVFSRSHGEIEFPGQFAEGYAYLKSKVYGDRPGRFYADEGVWLWMPRRLLQSDNQQLNYIAARKEDTLYIALTNQSFERQSATIKLNSEYVRIDEGSSLRMWANNSQVDAGDLGRDGSLNVDVPAQGLVAIALSGVDLAERKLPVPSQDRQDSTNTSKRFVELPFAEKTTALVLQYGERQSAYVYLQATDETVAKATLHYRLSGDASWNQVDDTRYPYEYTVEVPRNKSSFEFFVTTNAPDGDEDRSDVVHIETK